MDDDLDRMVIAVEQSQLCASEGSVTDLISFREEVLRREVTYLREDLESLRQDLVAERAACRIAQEQSTQAHEKLESSFFAGTHASWKRFLKRIRDFVDLHRTSPERPINPAPDLCTPSRDSLNRTILVVANHLPLFDQASGCLRLKTIIGMLSADGWTIHFGSMLGLDSQPGVLASHQGRGRYQREMGAAGVSQFLYGPKDITDFIQTHGRNLDWVFLSFPEVAEHFMPFVRVHCPSTRIAYDMVDFHGLRMRREAELFEDSTLLAAADRQKAIEVACSLGADLTFAVSLEEKARLLTEAPTAVVEVLPNIFEMPPSCSTDVRSRRDIFFVGGFWHRPNVDAVCWFVEKILPFIHKAMPEVVFRIAGANASDEVLALKGRLGVQVLGYVSDLGPLFDQHRVCVAPLRYGAGMKGKVGQSLSHALPVVSTSIGAEGMGLKDGIHVLVADEEQAFATQVIRLLNEDDLWSRLSVAGRALIEKSFSIDVVSGQLRESLNG